MSKSISTSEPSDADLLHRHLHDGDPAAFAALVARHLDLVYSVARRHLPSAASAEDVAQSVFIELARHGREIQPGTPLVAWLHVVARRTALNAHRADARRRARESTAAAHAEFAASTTMPSSSSPSSWSHIEPLLDEAVESLPAPDRAAILLRYFENKSLRDVGAALGTTDDAAQKRVSRALDQLRTFFLRRGVTVTAAGLASDLSAHALFTAPAALTATIAAATGAGVVHSTAVSASLLTMTLLEKSLLTAGALFTVGTALFDANTLRAQRSELTALRQQTDGLAGQLRETQSQHDLALSRSADARQRLTTSAATASPPADTALANTLTSLLERVARIRQMAADHPALAIPEFEALTDEDWLRFTRSLPSEVERDLRKTMSNLRFIAEGKFTGNLQRALRAYLAAHGDTLPAAVQQLAPFFNPPIPPAHLGRYKMTAHGNVSDLTTAQRAAVIEQNSPLDPDLDSVWRIGPNARSPAPADGTAAIEAIKAFAAANQGQLPTHSAQLLPYLRVPVPPARLNYYLKQAR